MDMKMNKAVFLDRDGTINVDYGYVYQYEKFEYIDGVTETLKKLQQMGYLLIVITNQSGVARGYFTEEDVKSLHQKMCEDLEKQGITITDIYYCPHLTGCTCRKPQLELFYRAAADHNVDLSRSIAIGDKIRDLSLCEKESALGFLISPVETDLENGTERITRVKNIREVISILEKKKVV